MIVNGYFIRKTDATIEVLNTSGIKLICDGPGAKRRAIEWTRNRVKGSMTPEAVTMLNEIEFAYTEREIEADIDAEIAEEEDANWNAEQDALLLEAEALGIDLSGVISG